MTFDITKMYICLNNKKTKNIETYPAPETTTPPITTHEIKRIYSQQITIHISFHCSLPAGGDRDVILQIVTSFQGNFGTELDKVCRVVRSIYRVLGR